MKATVLMALMATAYGADESFIQCKSNADCPNGVEVMNGMFNGTCCGRTNWVKGDPFKLGTDWAATAKFQ